VDFALLDLYNRQAQKWKKIVESVFISLCEEMLPKYSD
jgi:hypothetical protein